MFPSPRLAPVRKKEPGLFAAWGPPAHSCHRRADGTARHLWAGRGPRASGQAPGNRSQGGEVTDPESSGPAQHSGLSGSPRARKSTPKGDRWDTKPEAVPGGAEPTGTLQEQSLCPEQGGRPADATGRGHRPPGTGPVSTVGRERSGCPCAPAVCPDTANGQVQTARLHATTPARGDGRGREAGPHAPAPHFA